MKQADLFVLFEKKTTKKQITWFNFLKKKNSFCGLFSLKSSMVSFLESILDSIYVFKVVDFNFFGSHRLVWVLLRK